MAHTLAYALRVRSDLDIAAVRRAFQALIDRHNTWRAVFAAPDGGAGATKPRAGDCPICA